MHDPSLIDAWEMLRIIQNPSQIDWDKWDNLVKSHPEGNVFQSKAMYLLWSQVSGCSPIALAAVDKSGCMQGVLLGVRQSEPGRALGYFSSRVIVWGGPLVRDGYRNRELHCMLVRALVESQKKKAIYVEIRNLFDTGYMKAELEKMSIKYREHVNFILPIGSREDIQKRLSANRKRQIKKALSHGARIVEADSLEQVRKFYEILQDLYRNKIHKPLPQRVFFEAFYLAGKQLGTFLLVMVGDDVIGGMMCPLFQNRTIYEWYVCGLDEKYPDFFPSVLATWSGIEYAQKNGFQYFDFLGAGQPDKDYGVREFKARFGGDLVNYGRYMRINNRLLFQIGKIGLSIIGKARGHAGSN